MSIELERTDDILKTLGERKNSQFICGFSMETENMLEEFQKEAEEKEPGYDCGEQSENGRRRVWRKYECGHSDHRRL
mgnify:CR=1 FL=1